MKEMIVLKRVNLNVPEEWIKRKNDCGKSWREILGIGLLTIEDNPQLKEKLNEHEKSIQKIKQILEFFQDEIRDIKKERLK